MYREIPKPKILKSLVWQSILITAILNAAKADGIEGVGSTQEDDRSSEDGIQNLVCDMCDMIPFGR